MHDGRGERKASAIPGSGMNHAQAHTLLFHLVVNVSHRISSFLFLLAETPVALSYSFVSPRRY